jgi:Transposase
MAHFVGLDVSVKETSVCVVDAADRVILEQKAPTEPADIIALLTSLGVSFCRIGIEAGPLSQWLVNALTVADLPVICVETRHMKALLTAQQINKTDRNDARGIAQMMRVGLFKPVHVKTLVAQEQRMLLTSRKLLQRKAKSPFPTIHARGATALPSRLTVLASTSAVRHIPQPMAGSPLKRQRKLGVGAEDGSVIDRGYFAGRLKTALAEKGHANLRLAAAAKSRLSATRNASFASLQGSSRESSSLG